MAKKKSNSEKELPNELTKKTRKLFVAHYCQCLNAAEAARRAGYSDHNARNTAHLIMSDPAVREEIRRTLEKKFVALDISTERVLLELARCAFVDIRKVMQWDEEHVRLVPHDLMSLDDAAAISAITETKSEFGGSISVKMHDKLKALELLGKYLKLFVERKELTGKDGAPLVDSFTDLIKLVNASSGHNNGKDDKNTA